MRKGEVGGGGRGGAQNYRFYCDHSCVWGGGWVGGGGGVGGNFSGLCFVISDVLFVFGLSL